MKLILVFFIPVVLFLFDLMAKNKFAYREVELNDIKRARKKGPIVFCLVRYNRELRYGSLAVVALGLTIACVVPDRSTALYAVIYVPIISGAFVYGCAVSWTYNFFK